MTSVLIVDDHPIVLQGCRRILQDMEIKTITEATSVVSGYRSYLRQRPDFVIVDLTFEGDDLRGLDLIRRIAANDRNARIIAFSMHDDPTIVSRAIASGALGYVLKDTSPSELATAFARMRTGEPHLSHDLAMRVAMLRAKGGYSSLSGLTERETQILSLLGRGTSYDKIAAKLGISYKTVTNATSLMRSKLKMTSLADLIRFAIQNAQHRSD